jgi:hypothetical protein
MSIKIPTEFTPYSFTKFYDQMSLIGKSMPSNPLTVNETPERLKIVHWQNQEENIAMVKIWDTDGKDALIKYLTDVKKMELYAPEISKLSGLMAAFRSKYKEELVA